eukprot:gene3298-2786_t
MALTHVDHVASDNVAVRAREHAEAQQRGAVGVLGIAAAAGLAEAAGGGDAPYVRASDLAQVRAQFGAAPAYAYFTEVEGGFHWMGVIDIDRFGRQFHKSRRFCHACHSFLPLESCLGQQERLAHGAHSYERHACRPQCRFCACAFASAAERAAHEEHEERRWCGHCNMYLKWRGRAGHHCTGAGAGDVVEAPLRSPAECLPWGHEQFAEAGGDK